MSSSLVMPVSPDQSRLAHARIEALLHTLDLQLRRTMKSQKAKNVHDLRVATRRFTQALKIFKTCLGNTKAVRARCSSVMKLSGKVRDLDIAMKILRHEHGDDAHAAEVLARIERDRALRAKELLRSITRVNGRIAIPASNGPVNTEKVHDAVVKAGHRLFKRAEHLSRSDDPHPLRIAAKQLRYTLELGTAGNGAVDQLAELQSELGAIHDLETIREILRKHKGAKKLLPKLKKKQQKQLRQAGRMWKRDFGGKKNRELWIRRLEKFSKMLCGAGTRAGESAFADSEGRPKVHPKPGVAAPR
jgi:CHAD domain-containing protein